MAFGSVLLLSRAGLRVHEQTSLVEPQMSSGLPVCEAAGRGELLSLGRFVIREKMVHS